MDKAERRRYRELVDAHWWIVDGAMHQLVCTHVDVCSPRDPASIPVALEKMAMVEDALARGGYPSAGFDERTLSMALENGRCFIAMLEDPGRLARMRARLKACEFAASAGGGNP